MLRAESRVLVWMDIESKSQLRKYLALVGGRICAEEDLSRRWRRVTDGNAAESFSIW